jgi:hypothetical protein
MTDFSPSTLASQFLSQLRSACPGVIVEYQQLPSPLVQIAAKHPEVGGLAVFFDDEEVTVEIREYHLHFDCMVYRPGEPPTKDPNGVSMAVEWVCRFMADRIILEICMVDGAYSGGATYPLETFTLSDVPSNASLYTWSGPWTDPENRDAR